MWLRKQFFLIFCWAIFLSIVFSGCKQKEQIVTVAKKIKRYSVGKVIKQTNDNSLKFETLSVKKIGVSLTVDGKTNSFRGSYKIRRDSVIQIMTQKLAIPVGKLEVKADSFLMVYYIDQELFVGKNNYLSKQLGIDLDFEVLQALLSNKMFSYRQDPRDKDFKEFYCDIEDNMYKISSLRDRRFRKFNKNEDKLERYRNRLDEEFVIKQDIYIDPDSFVVRKMIFNNLDNNRLVKLQFSNYEKVMDQWFPGLIEMQLTGDKKIEMSIELSKISLNDETNFGFNFSQKFKKKLVE
jgi:hypothetical protein